MAEEEMGVVSVGGRWQSAYGATAWCPRFRCSYRRGVMTSIACASERSHRTCGLLRACACVRKSEFIIEWTGLEEGASEQDRATGREVDRESNGVKMKMKMRGRERKEERREVRRERERRTKRQRESGRNERKEAKKTEEKEGEKTNVGKTIAYVYDDFTHC